MSPRLPKIKFRNLRKDEFDQVLNLCSKEGRHMGKKSELLTWYKIDSKGFFVAVTEQGEVLGTCCAIRLSQFHGNIGMFVVCDKYRGCGIGKKIWEMAINHLENRNKGLSAVKELFPVYRDKAGFDKIANWVVQLYILDGKRLLDNLTNILNSDSIKHDIVKYNSFIDHSNDNEIDYFEFENFILNFDNKINVMKNSKNFNTFDFINSNYKKYEQKKENIFQYSLTSQPTNLLNNFNETYSRNFNLKNDLSFNKKLKKDKLNLNSSQIYENKNDLYVKIYSYSNLWISKLINYDEKLNGYDRSKIIISSVNEENSQTKIAFCGSKIVGYCTIKLNLQNMYMLCPLYADNFEIAKKLLIEFIRSMTIQQLAKGLVLKVPSCNQNAIKLMQFFKFEKQDYYVTRCFTDYIHKNATDHIYALQSTVFSSE